MNIGEKIQNEVRRQEMSIVDFAEQIHCQRVNVYDIFKRNDISIDLLAKISKVLNHNFFTDVANDYSLAEIPKEESAEEECQRKAVSQFFNVVPKVLKELGRETVIIFDGGQDCTPDFCLPSYGITFTIGSTWVEKTHSVTDGVFDIQLITDGDKISFYYVVNKLGSQMLDIKLDYKSDDEWKDLLYFAFQNFPNLRMINKMR